VVGVSVSRVVKGRFFGARSIDWVFQQVNTRTMMLFTWSFLSYAVQKRDMLVSALCEGIKAHPPDQNSQILFHSLNPRDFGVHQLA
jgi:hypothetical protein